MVSSPHPPPPSFTYCPFLLLVSVLWILRLDFIPGPSFLVALLVPSPDVAYYPSTFGGLPTVLTQLRRYRFSGIPLHDINDTSSESARLVSDWSHCTDPFYWILLLVHLVRNPLLVSVIAFPFLVPLLGSLLCSVYSLPH